MQGILQRPAFHAFIIFFVGLAAYSFSIRFEYILGLDDDWLVYYNPAIKDLSLKGIRHIFFEDSLDLHYYPLTYLSLAIDYHFFGLNAGMMRLHNIILHCFNAVWIYFIFKRLFRVELAIVTALAFVIHPLNIESVAWVVCRRQVLFLFYFLAAWYVYLIKLSVPSEDVRKRSILHIAAIILFGLSLLSKATGIFLPVILFFSRLLFENVNRWKDIRWKRAFIEYAPFLILALGSLYLNQLADSRNFLRRDFDYTAIQHIVFIFYSVGFYIVRTVFPGPQCVFYPSPPEGAPLPLEYYGFALVALIAIAGFFWALQKKRFVVAFLLGSYIASIAILSNRILLFSDLPSIVADRYYYQSGPFLIALLAFGILRLDKKTVRLTFYGIYLCFMTWHFAQYLPAWKNVMSLYDRIVEHHPSREFIVRSAMAEYRYGDRNKARERFEMAEKTTDKTYINNNFWFYDDLITAFAGLGDTQAVDSTYRYLQYNRPDIIEQLRQTNDIHRRRIDAILKK